MFIILYFWIILSVVLIIIEAVTVQLVTIWFAIGSIFALFANLLKLSIPVQVIIFATVSVIALIATRPIVKKIVNNKKVPTNSDRIIGKPAVVTETVNNSAAQGKIMVFGIIWTARSENGEIIEKDETVFIKRIEGVKAIVSKEE